MTGLSTLVFNIQKIIATAILLHAEHHLGRATDHTPSHHEGQTPAPGLQEE